MIDRLVTVVIPSRDMKEELEVCLSSLRRQTYRTAEIIVVDDASRDDTDKMIWEKFPEVCVIRNAVPIGPEASRNLAVKRCNSKYIAFLDADTKVEKDWIEELIKCIESKEDIGMCSCKILNFFNPGIIDNIGHNLYYDFSPIHIGAEEKDMGQFGRRLEVFGICLAGALVKREVFDKIGLFDEDYRGNFGDDEWTWRARARNYRCIFVPTAKMLHRKKTTHILNEKNIFLWEKNRILSMAKYYPLRMLFISIFYTLKRYVSYRISGRENRLALHHIIPIIFFAWREAFRFTPLFIQKRQRIYLDSSVLCRMEAYLHRTWPIRRGGRR